MFVKLKEKTKDGITITMDYVEHCFPDDVTLYFVTKDSFHRTDTIGFLSEAEALSYYDSL